MLKNIKSGLSKTPLRVLIADSSSMISEGLSVRLAELGSIQVVGSANKAISALALIDKVKPDVVLLDLQMPGESLLSILQLIKRVDPAPSIIVLTLYASAVLRERCLQAGADYVLSKTAELDALNDVLESLASNKVLNRAGR